MTKKQKDMQELTTILYEHRGVRIAQLHFMTPVLTRAKLYATSLSKENTKIGALITDANGEDIARGCNAIPEIFNHENKSNRRDKVVHAEMSAILNCEKIENANTIWIWGLAPCSHCLKHILFAGIKQIYFYVEYMKEDWAKDTQEFLGLLLNNR